MRQYLYHLVGVFFLVLCIAGCQQNAAPVDENARPMAYSEKQLESFLDSVGRLPIEPMVKKVMKDLLPQYPFTQAEFFHLPSHQKEIGLYLP
jgi:hypothetical protein